MSALLGQYEIRQAIAHKKPMILIRAYMYSAAFLPLAFVL